MIAKVVVDIAADREFDYLIPQALAADVKLGSRVNVSFGPRRTQGYVIGYRFRDAWGDRLSPRCSSRRPRRHP